MTPEEAGLTIPDTQATLRSRGSRGASSAGHSNSGARTPAGDSDSGSMPLLQPKVEPESADSGSDAKNSCGSSSEDDDDSNGPPQLERQEPFRTVNGATDVPISTDTGMLPVMRQVPFSGIRTKAARKQLPLNILVQDNNKLKGRARLLKVEKAAKRTKKPRAPKQRPSAEGLPPEGLAADRPPANPKAKVENGGRLTRQVYPKGSFYEGADLDDGLSSSESASGSDMGRAVRPPKKGKGRGNDEDNWRPGKWKPKKKTTSPRKASESAPTVRELVPEPAPEATSVDAAPEPAKSNRRARYKLQNPKKRILPQPEEARDHSRSARELPAGQLAHLPQHKSQGNVWNQGQVTDTSLRYHFNNGLEDVKRENDDSSFRVSPPEVEGGIEERMKDDLDSSDPDPADVAAMVFDYCGRANAASKPKFNVSTGYVQESA